MNKGNRNRLKYLKFKRRLKVRGLTMDDVENPRNNLYMFKSHGSPCSCWACRNKKYRETDRQKNKKVVINEEEMFDVRGLGR